MGTTCCRQGDEFELNTPEKPETQITLGQPEELNEHCVKKLDYNSSNIFSPTKDSATPSLSRYSEHTEEITRIQGLFRGAIARKLISSQSLLKPKAIIKYVTSQIKCVNNATKANQMEPFEVDWDLSENKGKLELRRVIEDEKGNAYAGYWNVQTNKKEGYGQELYADGSKYEGFWLDGEYDGKGRLIHANGDFYSGMWKKGKADGYGTFVGVDGMKYMGEWKNGEHQGKGQEIWTDGSIFEGNYVNGEKEGKGKFIWADKTSYEGNFSKSQMSGEGIILLII